MKAKRNHQASVALLKGLLLLYVFMGGPPRSAFCQQSFGISGGIGFPELINVGLSYQHKQMGFGLAPGYFPYNGDFLGKINVFALSADMTYHFAGTSAFSAQRPWFVMGGLTHFDPSGGDRSLFLNLRLGKDCNSSARNGVRLSAGLLFELYNDYRYHNPDHPGNKNFVVYPGAGISFFYRLKQDK
jgi:hypothetical protein